MKGRPMTKNYHRRDLDVADASDAGEESAMEWLAHWKARALQDVETIRGLRAAMQVASKTLKCPAAEYVPAMSEAWGILDDELARSFKPHHAHT